MTVDSDGQAAAATSRVSTRQLVLAGLLAALTAVLAYIRIPLPFTPVPITGQTLGVMLSGLLLGPRWGFAAQLTYLLLGIAGAPVFAGGQAGLAPVMGPTGGYLISYPLAAWLVGWVAGTGSNRNRVPGFGRAFLAALAGGVVLVYAVGAPWFALHSGGAWAQVWVGAVLPFIPGDVAKAVVAAILGPRVRRALADPGR
ncbi:MAG TPA: biotin transporter BioY [Thermaerobacter sp.]